MENKQRPGNEGFLCFRKGRNRRKHREESRIVSDEESGPEVDAIRPDAEPSPPAGSAGARDSLTA